MSSLQKNWALWRDHIFSLSESLGRKYGHDSLPVPLKQMAEDRMVKNVVFRPLLVDGCLTVTEAGFNIYVRCEKHRSQEISSRFQAERRVGSLPPRMRFTIAHEIAHTFFFELNKGRPQNRLAAEHHGTVSTLERVCNQAAARILLPSDLVRAECRTLDPFDPDSLRRLAKKAAVSPQMLVNRMGEMLAVFHGIGGFAYVEPAETGYRLTALRMHSALRGIFPKAAVGGAISDLISDRGFAVNGGEDIQVLANIRCSTGISEVVHTFRFSSERLQSASGTGRFVTFQRCSN